ncbi:hypothetical protein [Flavobacterium caseinilyticum]|uniref:Uncharacterized protein n=1 Tax=Flavobacterium caseinilyticum TaxID=2541732 RepID=A0A4R5AU58_9FLAO|nr:hypothetical protein [Flavobacterium caseinilyticum]TDD74664.1 hypothetical protein E0F89_14260 [Flavobacterium caseinilyticum]
MKNTLLISTVALAILGLIASRINTKDNKKVLKASGNVLLTNSVSKMLHSAKRAAIKDLQAKS